MMYDYLVVGAGFFGATFANIMAENGKRVLVIDKRPYLGGNCADEDCKGILVHKHGAHIFHTNDKRVWNFVNQFDEFVQFQNCVKARSGGKLYSLPFNMNTFYELLGISSPEKARDYLTYEHKVYGTANPRNLEEQAISFVGRDIYETLVKHYTEKQWNKSCKELDPSIIKRLPVRFTFDNNYFDDRYQGLPSLGYTQLILRMLAHCDVKIWYDFKSINDWRKLAKKLIFTGPIDEYFDYRLGKLEWRTLKFEHALMDITSYQGCPVINHCDNTVQYTRSIEHKHFLKQRENDKRTIVTFEYPKAYTEGDEQYYTIIDKKNTQLAKAYIELAQSERNVIFGGRLGTYRYLNMDQVVADAMKTAARELDE